MLSKTRRIPTDKNQLGLYSFGTKTNFWTLTQDFVEFPIVPFVTVAEGDASITTVGKGQFFGSLKSAKIGAPK